MREYIKAAFEQFTFLPKMFDTSTTKVQQCGIWSLVWSSIVYITDQIHHFTVNIAGVSVLFASTVFIVMIADYWTGIRASKKEWIEENPNQRFNPESKKGLRWVIKYVTYIMGFHLVNLMIIETGSLNIGVIENLIDFDITSVFMLLLKTIRLFLMFFVLRWELKSIDENLIRLGHDLKIFDFLDNTISSVTSIFKNKTGIEISDKKKEEKDNGELK